MNVKLAEIEAVATVEREGDGVRIILPGETGGFYVGVDGGEVTLLPDRSAAHRQLLALLGKPHPEPFSS